MERVPKSSFHLPNRSKYQVIKFDPPTRHLIGTVTGGLAYLDKALRRQTKLFTKHRYGAFTDPKTCSFVPSEKLPLLAGRYRYVEVLGRGQSSILISAKDMFMGRRLVAIKALHTNYRVLGAQESDCLWRINGADPFSYSPNLRQLNMFLFDDHYCMVFEMLVPTPINEYFIKTNMDRKERVAGIRTVALRLLQSIGFLQQQNVMHADLKPENVLMETDGELRTVKVVDFGNAIRCIHEEISLYYDDFELQTLLYRAPEVFFGLSFGLEIDLWSLGCLLFELYIGRAPFMGKDKTEVLKQMVSLLGVVPRKFCQKGKFFKQFHLYTADVAQPDATKKLLEKLECHDRNFCSFLSGLLRYDPSERLTVAAAVCHPFIAPEFSLCHVLPLACQSLPSGYSTVQLNPQQYTHRPRLADDVTRPQLTSLELLRRGTAEQPPERNNNLVHPVPRVGGKVTEDECDVILPTSPPYITHHSLQNGAVTHSQPISARPSPSHPMDLTMKTIDSRSADVTSRAVRCDNRDSTFVVDQGLQYCGENMRPARHSQGSHPDQGHGHGRAQGHTPLTFSDRRVTGRFFSTDLSSDVDLFAHARDVQKTRPPVVDITYDDISDDECRPDSTSDVRGVKVAPPTRKRPHDVSTGSLRSDSDAAPRRKARGGSTDQTGAPPGGRQRQPAKQPIVKPSGPVRAQQGGPVRAQGYKHKKYSTDRRSLLQENNNVEKAPAHARCAAPVSRKQQRVAREQRREDRRVQMRNDYGSDDSSGYEA